MTIKELPKTVFRTAVRYRSYLTDGALPYVWLALFLAVGYAVFSPFANLDSFDGDLRIKAGMTVVLLCLYFCGLFLVVRKRITYRRADALIIAAGIVNRFGYTLYTSIFYHTHDIGDLNMDGHLGYIYQIYKDLSLPASNSYQFSHPPFSHILCAFVAKIYALLNGNANLYTVFQSARLVPCFAACASLFVCYRIFSALGMKPRARTVAIAVLSFLPGLYVISACINNDSLMIFFFLTAFLYTIRWYKSPTYRNIVCIALSIGCAMSTKFSGGMIAPLTALVFLAVLVQRLRARNVRGLIGQFAAFAVICLPLGLWYHIRNYFLFGQPIGYVVQLSPTSDIYTGNFSIFQRFFAFDAKNFFALPYNLLPGNYQVWPYVLKSSLTGEVPFPASHDLFAWVLIFVNLGLILLSLASMAVVLLRERRRLFAVWSLFFIWLTQVGLFVAFNVEYPFACTMDFRYIVPTAVTGAAFLGMFLTRLHERNRARFPAPQAVRWERLSRLLETAGLFLLAVFAFASTGFVLA